MTGYLLIDPDERAVRPVACDGTLAAIYAAMQVYRIEVVSSPLLAPDEALYVDEEGLINGRHTAWFMLRGFPQPILGPGLLHRVNGRGDTVAPRTSLDDLADLVSWVEPLFSSKDGVVFADLDTYETVIVR